MVSGLMPKAPAPVPSVPEPSPQLPQAPDSTLSVAAAAPDSEALAGPSPADSAAAVKPAADTLAAVPSVIPAVDSTAAKPEATQQKPQIEGYPPITYELATRQMTAREMADFVGVDRSLVNTGYRMAGRTRKPATMSPHEMSSFIVGKLLPDKRYAAFVSKEQKAQLLEVHRLLDSAFLAGPSVVAQLDTPVFVHADSTFAVAVPLDSTALAYAADTTTVVPAVSAPSVPEPQLEEEDDYVPTPLERLAEMYMSDRRYSAGAVYSALRAAGVKLSRDDVDLLYLYAGSRKYFDQSLRMTPAGMLEFLYEDILPDPKFARFIDDEARESLDSMKGMIGSGIQAIRSDSVSVALALTSYNYESLETFEFLDRFRTLAERSLPHGSTVMGESVIYKEFKEDFPSELLLLTILTVGSIFLIVLFTFKSLVVPILLIITVMSGVYVNVFVSGLGGNTMYFLAYLIVQSVLMGATIDYSILFTSYYREERMGKGIADALADAFRRAGHSILTSGLILTLAPYAMSWMISDQMVSSILKCLAIGALAAILIILFIQPGVIAVCDRFIAPKGAFKEKRQ